MYKNCKFNQIVKTKKRLLKEGLNCQKCVATKCTLYRVSYLSLTDANYKVAKERLEKKYSNKESIKHTLLQTILGFKGETNPKFTKCSAAVTGFNNALVELETIHEVDTA